MLISLVLISAVVALHFLLVDLLRWGEPLPILTAVFLLVALLLSPGRSLLRLLLNIHKDRPELFLFVALSLIVGAKLFLFRWLAVSVTSAAFALILMAIGYRRLSKSPPEEMDWEKAWHWWDRNRR